MDDVKHEFTYAAITVPRRAESISGVLERKTVLLFSLLFLEHLGKAGSLFFFPFHPPFFFGSYLPLCIRGARGVEAHKLKCVINSLGGFWVGGYRGRASRRWEMRD